VGNNKMIHIFTDSLNTIRTLLNPIILEKLFYLVEDIRNLAQFSDPRFKFIIHWIPSHIEHTSFGTKPIHGNIEADRLAREVQILAAALDHPNNICLIRDKIFNYSAALISNIDALIISNSVMARLPTTSVYLMPYGTSLEMFRDIIVFFLGGGRKKKKKKKKNTFKHIKTHNTTFDRTQHTQHTTRTFSQHDAHNSQTAVTHTTIRTSHTAHNTQHNT